MMKRLLILTLALSLTAASYAVTVRLHADAEEPQNTTVYNDDCDTVTVIVAGPEDDYQVYFDITPGDCWNNNLTDVQVLYDDLPVILWQIHDPHLESTLVHSCLPGEDCFAGDHFSTTFECLCVPDEVCAVVELYEYEYPYDLIDKITIMCTPEPMALALLALGGLMLRRRK